MNLKMDTIKRIVQEYQEVIAAYVFGSSIEGYETKRSDVDIAVLLEPSLDKFTAFKLKIDIGDELERKLKRKVDLVNLNRAPLSLAFRIIKGKLILEKDPVKRALFVSNFMSRYYDHRWYLKFHHQTIYEWARGG